MCKTPKSIFLCTNNRGCFFVFMKTHIWALLFKTTLNLHLWVVVQSAFPSLGNWRQTAFVTYRKYQHAYSWCKNKDAQTHCLTLFTPSSKVVRSFLKRPFRTSLSEEKKERELWGILQVSESVLMRVRRAAPELLQRLKSTCSDPFRGFSWDSDTKQRWWAPRIRLGFASPHPLTEHKIQSLKITRSDKGKCRKPSMTEQEHI